MVTLSWLGWRNGTILKLTAGCAFHYTVVFNTQATRLAFCLVARLELLGIYCLYHYGWGSICLTAKVSDGSVRIMIDNWTVKPLSSLLLLFYCPNRISINFLKAISNLELEALEQIKHSLHFQRGLEIFHDLLCFFISKKE